MRTAYPIVMRREDPFVVVYVPDFDVNTEGHDIADAMAMARDVIGLVGIDMEDDKRPLPEPSTLEATTAAHPEAVVTLVDVDFQEYRRQHDMRTVRRNVSLPSWLNEAAEKAGLNVSATLQTALKEALNLS